MIQPSIWELETFYRKREVMILGSGFTGLWTAISIKEKFPEKSILIIEKENIPTGASTRNAGFACFGSLTEILADAQKMGWDKTLELVQLRFEGLKKIQHYFPSEEIDFNLCGGFEILHHEDVLHQIPEVNSKLQEITGSPETFRISNEKIEKFGLGNTHFLVENKLEGSLHSGKLVKALIKKAQDLGIEFLFGTEILSIEESESGVTVTTKKAKISTEKLIHCTNAFAKTWIPEVEITPVRGQILLTEPIEDLPLKGTFHYDEGFYYFRNWGNRILLGGARNKAFAEEETDELATTTFIQNELENFLKTVILPNKKEVKIENRWSGIMAVGTDKSPIIEKISSHQIATVRLSGMGVALAPKIGELVAEML